MAQTLTVKTPDILFNPDPFLVVMFKKTQKGWGRKQGFHLPMQADIPSSLSLPTFVGVFGEALDEACCVVLLEVLNGHRKTLVDFEQL